jgi:hypothetical protein
MKFNSVFDVLRHSSFTKLLVILLISLSVAHCQDDTKTWCWTKSMANEPSFVLNPANGGLNWGFCQRDKKPAMVKYVAIVNTSQIEKSETSSVLKVQIFGDKGRTEEKNLSSSGFERGSERRVEIEAEDVGKLEKIAIRVVGSQGYRCRSIMLQKGNLSRTFECLKRIEPCPPGKDPKECILEMEADGDTPYEITVKTNEDDDAGTKSPLFIALKGDKGESRLKILSEMGLSKGSSETIITNIKDVGLITGLRLYLGGHGKWKPATVEVKNLVTGQVKNFDLNNPTLISPGQDTYSMDQSDRPVSQEGEGGENNSSSGGEPTSEDKDAINMHNPWGGLIDQAERKTIIDLTCEQKLINPSSDKILFGPDYPTRNINYLRVLARCPIDCHKVPGIVSGVGIHPDETPICLAALVDRAISLYGGIISISIFPGQDSYGVPSNFPRKVDQITVKSLETKSVMKSYVVSRVDNVDLVEKDIRILNHKGELASEGRLEMRVQGKWGSVCTIGNTPSSAKIICKNLGYRDGEWKSPVSEEGRDFCRNYKGFDYCAADAGKIHFYKMECTPKDNHINTCNKELADMKTCTHGFDSIINCFNEVYETELPVPVGVVRLAATTVEKESLIGRLEMFNHQKFSPICELGFSDEGATVACKQMGFSKGTYINDARAKNFKLPEDSNEKFAAGDVVCTGNEKSLKGCKSKMNDITCKHDQDVVIACEGEKGDTSGKSQYMPKPITPSPELGKLGLPKNKIDCTFKGTNPIFRGDPGSVFLVKCPANCGKEPGTITGTGIYTSDSSICLAAYHSGVIESEKGGLFAVIKTFSQTQWSNTSRYGLMSSPLNVPWTSAFSISQVNSGWVGMSKVFNESPKVNNREGMRTSFMQSSISVNSIPKPTFKFLEPTPNYTFNPKTAIQIDTHTLSRLSTYTLVAKFKMEKFDAHKMLIFSYSGCSGFNVMIDKADTLILGDMCNPTARINTKIIVPLNENITLFVTYEKANIQIYLQSEKMGIVKREIKSQLEINPAKEIGIGRLGQTPKGIFNGSINYIVIYDTVLPEEAIPIIEENLKNENSQGQKLSKTEDGRDCLSPCIDSTPGEGTPPPDAQLDGDNDANHVPLPGDKNKPQPKPGDIGTYDKSESNNQETIRIECETNATDKRFTGEAGKYFRVHCPVCTTSTAVVFGTGIYHPLSSICKAAMHMGHLKIGAQGDFILELSGKKESFNGSVGADKSLSGSFGSADSSFIVKVATPHTKISCERTAGEDKFAGAAVGTKFVVVCPSNCSKAKVSCYGSEIYADNSSICYAGIHYGILSDKGGEIEFIIEGEQSSFKSTKGFGVISKPKESYIRSFRFLGQKSTLSVKFHEDYKGKIIEKWSQHVEIAATDKEKDSWEYVKENRQSKGQFETFQAIHHTGVARVDMEYGFASWVILKNAEFANGVVKFNIKALDMEPFGVVFRYVDPENYYAIQFNIKDHRTNIRLIAKVNSSLRVLESKYLIMLQPDAWFRCTLILNYEEMKFLMQQETAREHKLVFTKPIKELQRGSFGIASNGNNNVYFSGVSVEDYKPGQIGKTLGNISKIRTFEEMIKKTHSRDIKSFCGEVYLKPSRDFDRCKQPHSFCQTKCDSLVPYVQEGIINFRCFRDCVKAVNNNNLGKLEITQPNITSGKWEPVEGEKIDLLVKGTTFYRPGKVTNTKMILFILINF